MSSYDCRSDPPCGHDSSCHDIVGDDEVPTCDADGCDCGEMVLTDKPWQPCERPHADEVHVVPVGDIIEHGVPVNEWGRWWVAFGQTISSLLGVPAEAFDWEADAAVVGDAIAAEFAMVWNAGAVMADATRVVEHQPILKEI